MLDRYNRNITYLRISVTDRCNLRCSYCMPEHGIACIPHSKVLSFEEIYSVVNELTHFGITKVRLTGGEPLVRKDVHKLVEMLASIPEIQDLGMTTNGILLPQYALKLKQAGLLRLNISLDTLDSGQYKEITRGGNLEDVFHGIDAAKQAGFENIKINAVKFENTTFEDELALRRYCESEKLQLRFINQMNLKTGEFSVVEGGEGGNCKNCNRLRLTAIGMLKPCLFSDKEYSIRDFGVSQAAYFAINNKPKCGSMSNINEFYSVGG